MDGLATAVVCALYSAVSGGYTTPLLVLLYIYLDLFVTQLIFTVVGEEVESVIL